MTTYATVNDLHSDRQTDADRPDVRVVQVAGWQECHHVNLATALGATHGVHQVRDLAAPGKAGVAVTWRKDAATLIAKGLALGHRAVEGMMGRYLAWAVLEIDGRVHAVISGHRPPLRLKHLWPTFDANVDALIDRLRAEYRPDVVVVLLDANQSPPTPLVTKTGMRWHGVGIDGALVSGATVSGVRALPLGDSDHRPVAMTVTPKEPVVTWRVAKSLNILLAEINNKAPNRSKASDGSIGDAAHATRDSDHNPWVKDASGTGVVRARDFTNDPADGLNCDVLAVHLAKMLGTHSALGSGAYIIWEDRIISTDRLSEGWRPYGGSNEHRLHLHLSVGKSGYDSTAPWGIATMGTSRPAPTPALPPEEDDMPTPKDVWDYQVPFTGDPDKVGDKRPVYVSVVETHNAVEALKDEVAELKTTLAEILAAIKAG